jgi:hypothetical protein
MKNGIICQEKIKGTPEETPILGRRTEDAKQMGRWVFKKRGGIYRIF